MLVRLAGLITLMLVGITPVQALGNEPQGKLLVGSSKADVTPAADALPPGHSIRDPLFARVIFVRSGEDCAVVASVDRALITSKMVSAVRDRFTQCAATNFFVSATHTHSAADLPTDWMDPEQTRKLENAIVEAAVLASRNARGATMGFTTTDLHLNVNRDAFDGVHWYQGTNKSGVSDKTMSVVYFLDGEGQPIGFIMNYGMHPINFHLSGVVSADFPGEASGYIERRYPGAVALFTQAASGDQNPLLSRPLGNLIGPRLGVEPKDDLRSPGFWELAAKDNRENPGRKATPAPAAADRSPAFLAVLAEVDEIVKAMGAIMGETVLSAIAADRASLASSLPIFSGTATVTCPGRDRVDTSRREGMDPGYRDGEPVSIGIGLLRLGDVALVGIDSEVYTELVMHLKARSPLTRTVVIGLANGLANSGYIYSDNAAHHLTFQVIGSRLKPGCAEERIIEASLRLIHESDLVPH